MVYIRRKIIFTFIVIILFSIYFSWLIKLKYKSDDLQLIIDFNEQTQLKNVKYVDFDLSVGDIAKNHAIFMPEIFRYFFQLNCFLIDLDYLKYFAYKNIDDVTIATLLSEKINNRTDNDTFRLVFGIFEKDFMTSKEVNLLQNICIMW